MRVRLAIILSVLYSVVAGCFAVPAAAITKGYATDDTKLLPGMVAALSVDANQQQKVERATQENVQKIVGISTTVEDSLVTVASGKSQVYIENEGDVLAYIADINGEYKKGDQLTISPLRGVLMKASTGDPIVALATESFNDAGAEMYPVQGVAGGSAKVIKAKVNLDTLGSGQQGVAVDESSLERLGRSLTGKQVGELRVIIALIIFFIVMIAEGAILYGAISSAITSLGRNPLAKIVIRRELGRVIGVVVFVLSVGLAAIYAILWV